MPALNQHFFSTGILLVGPVGSDLTEADHRIAAVQDASFELSFQKAEVFETPQESLYAVAIGHHSGQCRLRATAESIDRRMYTALLNAEESGGSPNTITVHQLVKPQFQKVVLQGLDADDAPITITLFRAICMGLTLGTRLTGFGSIPLDFEAYPSADNLAANGQKGICSILFGEAP